MWSCQKNLQPVILRRLHEGHMGTEKMLLRARSAIFRTGLTADVTKIAKNCQVCQTYAPKQSQEPILVHEPTATTRPWFKLGSDIFEVKGKYYIVVADYYSRFPYVKQLTYITSHSIINVFKTLFTDHRFCEILCTDNGPFYVSKEFTTFLNDCSIRHITSDPMHLQSNGFAESMVNVMKNLITKAIASNEYPNWALLAYRVAPLSASLTSPAEMLHDRPLRTNIPSQRHAAQSDHTLEAESCQQSYAQKHHQNNPHHYKKGKVLPCILTIHIHVSPLLLPKCCPPGQLSTNDGGAYCRNRRDIRTTQSTMPNRVTPPQLQLCYTQS